MTRFVLLVEDNPSDEKLTVRAMQKANPGTEVVVTRDGREALDYLSATDAGALPAVVLLDLKLPKVDGLDVLRQIRADERTRLVPVVVLTSSAQEEDLLQSYSLGANAYVRKPVDFQAFVEVARTLGQFWLRVNERPPIARRRG